MVLMEINQSKLEEIRRNADSLINLLGITYTLDELINDFNKIYFNIHGDDNRLKIIGNKLYNEDGKQKQKAHQLYRLSKESRNLLDVSSLGDKLTDVMELCYFIEQLKLVKKIDNVQEKIDNIPMYVISHQKELNKFFQRKKR